jgi:hypothetical protein
MSLTLPVSIFGAAPGDLIVACLLAEFGNGTQTSDERVIVCVDGNAKPVVGVCGHL